uniref:TGF_BETA_2 domain-containing protein n=1 Tax=Syphacia muris TaxID=451379 RepID=A0A158R445_9BILA
MRCWWQTAFTVLTILCEKGVFTHFSTAFYVDNDQLQSVPLHVTKKVGAYLESNIVELLGIKRHGYGVKDELATRFMTQLYKSRFYDFDRCCYFTICFLLRYLENGTDMYGAGEKAIALGEADTIVSFRPHAVNDRYLNNSTRLTFKCPELFSEGRLLYSELRISLENASKPLYLAVEFDDHRIFSGDKRSLSDFGKWYGFGIASFSDSRQRVHLRTKRNIPIGQENFEDPSTLFTSKPKSLFTWKSGYGNECSVKSLYVDFKYLNWQEWVIAPDGFHAHYCDGSCSFPLTSRMNATNHAIVQTLVYLIDPKKTTEPKCAPTLLKPMKILFVDYNRNVILKRYRDMVVEDCGCQ